MGLDERSCDQGDVCLQDPKRDIVGEAFGKNFRSAATLSRGVCRAPAPNTPFVLPICFIRSTTCTVLDAEDMNTTRSRLLLVGATKIVLAETLRLIGVSAPEKM